MIFFLIEKEIDRTQCLCVSLMDRKTQIILLAIDRPSLKIIKGLKHLTQKEVEF
jgi:hypothetical protein